MKKHFMILILFVLELNKMNAANYYVSSTASLSGNGSFNNPWQLQQALNSPNEIKNPKDTVWIWLKGGTYKNTFDGQTSFSCFTNGKDNAPIIFRNYQNERVIIDGSLAYTMAFVLGNCNYTWIWGLEFLNSSVADRDHSAVDRLGNVYCTAENIKFINLIVHDMGSGLDSWKTSRNSETYGCIIYNIGNNLNNNGNWEGHGHGMYLQNDTFGIKKIHNNIVFNTYGYGIKIWQTTTTAALGNFDVERNIVFNGGAASENLGGVGNNYRTHNFFVVANGVNNPVANTVIKHNYTYSGTNTPRPPVNAFGLNYGVRNMILDSNYFTCQTRLGFNNTPIFDASFKGNKIISGIPAAYGYYLWGFTPTDFPQNTYLPIQDSIGLEYFVLPNKYEEGRAHIVIYNWGNANNVQVNLANTGLKPGEKYELINVEDYYNDIIKGTYPSNGIITISMLNHSSLQAIGSIKKPVSQFPTFGTFVIRKSTETSTTSTENSHDIMSMNIFPNPVHHLINVKCDGKIEGNYKIKLMNLTGSNVKECNQYLYKGLNQIKLDINDYSKGVYIIELVGMKFSSLQKIIIE